MERRRTIRIINGDCDGLENEDKYNNEIESYFRRRL